MTSISNISSTPPTSSAPVDPQLTKANKALTMILTSTDVVQALSTQSSTYVPPSTNQVLSTLWAVFDIKGNTVTKDDVQKAVIAEGGQPSDATALWAHLDPNNTPSINAKDFVNNTFVLQGVQSNLSAINASVLKVQQISTGSSNSVLDQFAGTGSDILYSASTGQNNFSNSFNYLNLFV